MICEHCQLSSQWCFKSKFLSYQQKKLHQETKFYFFELAIFILKRDISNHQEVHEDEMKPILAQVHALAYGGHFAHSKIVTKCFNVSFTSQQCEGC